MNKYKVAVAALSIGLVCTAAFGAVMYREKQNAQTFLSNSYERAFHEAAGCAEQVTSLLVKLDAVERPEQSAVLFAELWRQAAAAHTELSTLPYNAALVADTQKYLSQVSDFAYAMMLKTIDGQVLTADDRINLTQIKSLSPAFSGGLTSILNQAAVTGGVKWAQLAEEDWQTQDGETVSNVPPEVLLGSLRTVTQPFHEAPGLVYDGPFSDHIQTLAPRTAENRPMLTRSEGRNIVLDMLAANAVQTVEYIGETDAASASVIPVLSYAATLAGDSEPSIFIDVTKYGGVPLWMLRQPTAPTDDARITLSEAIAHADAFLAQAGFPSMKQSYYEYADASVVVNYAPVENSAILYPDLVKVKVSMADGTIEGLEALGYVMMHGPRALPEPTLSVYDALNFVSPKLAVASSQLALIPMGSYREVLCYEFRAENGDAAFLIYINADTGRMERMFELVMNEYGVLVQ